MNPADDDWSDLRQTWQAGARTETPELGDVQARVARARRAAVLRTAVDAGACLLGAAIGIASLLRGTGHGIVVGLAALGFTAFGAALAWRNARLRRPPVTGTVAEALDAAIALERSAETWARAVVPMAAAATAFLGVLLLAAAWDPDADATQLRRWLQAVGLASLLLAVATVAGLRLADRARDRRQVLEQRRRELDA